MNNSPAILRSLVTFAVIVPLAVFVGYLLSDPLDRSSFTYYGFLALILIFPIFLRWHHPLLVFCWNTSMVVYFLPGQPHLWLVMAAVSLGITLLQRATGGVKHLISVPQVTWSLIFLTGVILFTAKMTGMGLRSMGSETYGGKRYAYLLGAIMGYFALSGHRIPPEKARLYVGLFFLSGLTAIIGDFVSITPGFLSFIYWFFPGNWYYTREIEGLRLGGAMFGSAAVFSYMLAKYGIRGIFLSGKTWRWVVFFLTLIYSLFAGFRGQVILYALIFVVQFYLEGLHRTKLLPIFGLIGISAAVLLVPLTPHLPYSFQRSLAFLPLNVNRSVRQTADDSWRWRVEMWKAVLPQIPQHLLLGKGFALSSRDFDLLTGSDAAIRPGGDFAENQFLAVGGVYHNGQLTVLLTFGLWGCIAMIWFWSASMWVLYRNYRYGDPALRTVNMFLMVIFGLRIFIFAAIDTDMLYYCGWLGLGVSLNGGVCQPVPQPQATNKFQAFNDIRSHLRPTFRRH